MDELKPDPEQVRSPQRRVRAEKQRGLIVDIAIGVWLGGMALAVTWTVISMIFAQALIGSLRMQIG